MNKRQMERARNRERYRIKWTTKVSELLSHPDDFPSIDLINVKELVKDILDLSPNNNHNRWLKQYLDFVELQKGTAPYDVKLPKKKTTLYVWLKEQRGRFSAVSDSDKNEEVRLRTMALEAAGYSAGNVISGYLTSPKSLRTNSKKTVSNSARRPLKHSKKPLPKKKSGKAISTKKPETSTPSNKRNQMDFF